MLWIFSARALYSGVHWLAGIFEMRPEKRGKSLCKTVRYRLLQHLKIGQKVVNAVFNFMVIRQRLKE